MNELEVARQIEQMVKFIRQEAEEKANEIRVSAEEEFNLEKLQLVEQEKAKIRREYERREGQVEVKKKIEYSKQLNEMRLKVLTAKEAAMQDILADAVERLKGVSKSPPQYKELMEKLLVQAMQKLKEPVAVVKVRQADVLLVKEVLEPARATYKKLTGQDAPQLAVDSSAFLPPAPAGDDREFCNGGIALTSPDGRIVCGNTLDDRLRISYHANLPEIRQMLFGDA
mmetsp:Transcript_16430/g.48933  ORF Transcript_16430/g.48933 Transcript_16430/m.48933 type:complete len:227 (-) Transcript_16430:1006-1686(-)